ncbi:hypothetical protein LTR36_006087 [Oleoguttula mirabilis]|uniref:Uncharacterized protein n=1 Tax=Oleoguttula mirabilis TaxID=1507867 RepID=A0AAV9JDI7_9PEZI|nr:hypothetical protein LTR36_006087 [Oleoguttula mirabilis]
MAPIKITNLARLYKHRYDTAHDLLETDVAAARRGFTALLTEHQLALWMRVQCNSILGYIASTVEEADHYLTDARHVLHLYTEGCSKPDPDVAAMEETLEDVARDIQHRREHPWKEESSDEDEDEDKAEEESGVHGADAEEPMLLGHVGDPLENTLIPLTGAMDEMLLGDVDYSAGPIKRTPSPYSADVDSQYMSEAVFSSGTPRVSSASPLTQLTESSDGDEVS